MNKDCIKANKIRQNQLKFRLKKIKEFNFGSD